jgi:FtsZ-binding cell division protein ZapB
MMSEPIQIVQGELDRLKEENNALRKQVEAYMSEKW